MIDYIKSKTAETLVLIRWQNIYIEDIENPKPNGSQHEINYEIIRHLEVPVVDYIENVENAVKLEKERMNFIESRNQD